jgi:hypothetical protein
MKKHVDVDFLSNKFLIDSLDFEKNLMTPVILESLSYTFHKVDKNLYDILNQEILDMEARNFNNEVSYNDQLAGSISREYELKNYEAINSYLEYIIPEFWKSNRFPNDSDVYNLDWKLQKQNKNGLINHDVWVNFQKKHEYNPLHAHSGELSFVLWMRIPFDRKDEQNVDCINKKRVEDVYAASSFTFRWPGLNGGSIKRHVIPLDKSFEGVMAIFPSWLMHEVYPFYTSDEYRVSISGNIVGYPKENLLPKYNF